MRPLLKEMRFFVENTNNPFLSNIHSSAMVGSGRSARIRKIGIFTHFDDFSDYESFWSKCSFDLVLGGRVIRSFKMTDVCDKEGLAAESVVPSPSIGTSFMGWFNLDQDIDIASRMDFSVILHSDDILVSSILESPGTPHKKNASIIFYLDTIIQREIL